MKDKAKEEIQEKALRYLLDYYNAPEFEDVKDETTQTWESIAHCMTDFAEQETKEIREEKEEIEDMVVKLTSDLARINELLNQEK